LQSTDLNAAYLDVKIFPDNFIAVDRDVPRPSRISLISKFISSFASVFREIAGKRCKEGRDGMPNLIEPY